MPAPGPHAPSAYIFDLDRTLVDLQSFTDYAAALRDLGEFADPASGASVPDADWDAPTLSTMAILVALSGDPLWEPASRAVARHERAAIPRSTPMPGLQELDSALDGAPRAVVTLLPEDVAREVLGQHGVHIDIVVGRDPQIPAKPSGAGLLVAAERMGVSVEACVMIGDSSWDRAAAMDAGAAFVGVPVSVAAFDDTVPVAAGLLEAVAAARTQGRS